MRTDQERAGGLRDRWRRAPVDFFQRVLGLQTWEAQAKIATAIANADRIGKTRFAVKSGHKIGKSTTAAGLICWFPLVYPRGRVVVTATAGHQVRNIIWPEVMRLYHDAPYALGGHLSPDPSRGWYGLPNGSSVVAINPEKPVGMAGLSAPKMLIIVDEASGFDERLWEPLIGNMAGGAILLALGNPTDTSGTFFDAFGLKSHLWETYTVSSATTPNVVSGEFRIPGLASRPWLCEMLEEHTGIRIDSGAPLAEIQQALEEATDVSQFVNVRILGRFPTSADDVVVGLSLVEAAARRWPDTKGEGRLQLGVDVARFGDDSSMVAPRRGLRVELLEEFKNCDGPMLADKVVQVLAKYRRVDEPEKPVVAIDQIGVGASCYDVLVRLQDKYDFVVAGVSTGERAGDEEKYTNLRSELHFIFRDWLRDGGAIPTNDQRLHGELVAPKYRMDARNRYQVEKKDDVKKRLRRSPDRADACMLSTYEPKLIDLNEWVA